MASIYIYNLKGGKCVELNTPRIEDDDISELKSILPSNLEGLAFESPLNKFDEETITEIRVEDQEPRVAEYLKGIGNKLEKLKQVSSALRFYDLAFRVSGNSEVLILKAQALSQAGQVERAEKLLRRFSRQHPNRPEPFFFFGKNALARADYQKAQEHFEEAQKRIRSNNVEHRGLQESLEIYQRFISIYLDRDQLFTRDLSPEDCIKEIIRLRQRTKVLTDDIRNKNKNDLEGMVFFLETQDKIFEKWLEEMAAK